jgi:heterodisulfide reductase subunit A-like polyferredoxin
LLPGNPLRSLLSSLVQYLKMADPNPYPTAEYGRNTNRADVLIIGAGLSGMTTAIDMIRNGNGRNFIIVERGNQVGGTWNDQRYPGCCCVGKLFHFASTC